MDCVEFSRQAARQRLPAVRDWFPPPDYDDALMATPEWLQSKELPPDVAAMGLDAEVFYVQNEFEREKERRRRERAEDAAFWRKRGMSQVRWNRLVYLKGVRTRRRREREEKRREAELLELKLEQLTGTFTPWPPTIEPMSALPEGQRPNVVLFTHHRVAIGFLWKKDFSKERARAYEQYYLKQQNKKPFRPPSASAGGGFAFK